MFQEMEKVVSTTSPVDFQINSAWRLKLSPQCVSCFQSHGHEEAQLLINLDGLLSFGTIALAIKVPRMSDPKGQKVAVLAWSGMLLLVYSFLLNVFRIKNGGYPFFLPPF